MKEPLPRAAPRMIFLGVFVEKSKEDDDERSRWWCGAATPGARMMDTAAVAIVVAVVRASYLSFSRVTSREGGSVVREKVKKRK